LKHKERRNTTNRLHGFREKSTKTRIETTLPAGCDQLRANVLEKNPPKQGLKLL